MFMIYSHRERRDGRSRRWGFLMQSNPGSNSVPDNDAVFIGSDNNIKHNATTGKWMLR